MEIDIEKVKRKPNKKISLTIRITQEDSKFLAERNVSATKLFSEAVKCLRK